MDFACDTKTTELAGRLEVFMAEHVIPAEPVFAAQTAGRVGAPPVVAELQDKAQRRGLWNLFLPEAGLSNLQYAPLAEITGRSPQLGPIAVNCSAPDTGNMELLSLFGTESQREEWLIPLLAARIRSAFCMTEPEVASSDARTIATRIDRDGDDLVISGRKWFATGALDPRCELLVVMGCTNGGADPHRRQSMVLVPRNAPGVRVGRGMSVFGYADEDHGGHAEVEFDHVRVPAANLLGAEGEGFAMAQARLGPGRLHHCMRLVGMAERALGLMCARVRQRTAFGAPLSEQGVVTQWAAEARVRIEQVRLLGLKTAWLLDTRGNRGARSEVQALKIAAPRAVEWVVDRAIQAHGALGLSQDTPLAFLWAQARALRIADGPDEVHLRSLGRRELARHRGADT